MAESPEYYWLNSPSIIVDDSDSTINYDGTWQVPNRTETAQGLTGSRDPILDTRHILQIFNGSFSYNFTGGGISVYGSSLDNSNCTIQCILDGNLLRLDPNSAKARFGQIPPVCLAFGLPDNAIHTISVLVSVAPQDQPADGALTGFAFDYFLVQPPEGTTPWDNGNQDVYVPVLDTLVSSSNQPTLNFGLFFIDSDEQIADVSRGWIFDPKNGFYTTTSGSQFNVTFTGTSLWWYGFWNNSFPPEPSSATFAIDGGPPSSFKLGHRFDPSQSLVFMTPVLENTTHLLEVVSHGNETNAPLTLQSLVIRKSSDPSSTLALLPTSTTSKPPVGTSPSQPVSTSEPATKGSHLGSILAGVGGGILFLLLFGCGIFNLARRASRRRRSTPVESSPATTPEPFRVPEEPTGVIMPRKERRSQDGIEHPDTQQLQPPILNKWSRVRNHLHDSPDLDCVPSSPDDKLQEEGALYPEPPVNPFVVVDDPQHSPIARNTTHQQTILQTANGLNSTRPTPLTSTSYPRAERESVEESEMRMASISDGLPAYTSH